MNRPGDWNCRSCQHHNFQRRDSCQRCGDLRPTDNYASRLGFTTGPDVRPGDWYCAVANCAAHNFASRSTCFKCGALKDDIIGTGTGTGAGFDSEFARGGRGFGFSVGGSAARSGWKSGDWICNRFGCNEHNFASRMECFRCSAPRESGNKASF